MDQEVLTPGSTRFSHRATALRGGCDSMQTPGLLPPGPGVFMWALFDFICCDQAKRSRLDAVLLSRVQSNP